jgi:protoporphyrinogen oxidase
METNKVAIIGAGPAGLTAAYFLIKKGIEPAIFEAGKEIGGLGGSVMFFNKSFDIGPHIFLESSQKESVEFWKEIGGNDLVTMQLSRGMILNHTLIRFPPEPLGILKALGPYKFVLAAFSTLKAKLLKNKSFDNSGEFFQNQYGTYFRENVFNPFCEKYMGITDFEVDPNFATSLTSFVKESGKTDVVTDEYKLKSLIYPKQGTKMIWSGIAERILDKGTIHLEKKLNRVVCDEEKVTRLCFTDGTETEPEFVVTSLPVVTLLQLMDNTPASILELSKKLRYRNTVLVYIQLSGVACDFHYVTAFDHSIEAGRITNFNTWQLESLADSPETVLCVEYWCDNDDVNWKCTNEEIVEKAISELTQVTIIKHGNVSGTGVLRLAKSHPVLSTEHVSALFQINEYLAKFKNLVLAGRHATFKWDGQADNISAGMKLAEKISATIISKENRIRNYPVV